MSLVNANHGEETMDRYDYLTADQIEDALENLGETGYATVTHGGLYTHREENADERYEGAVADEAEAKAVLQAWWSRR